MARRSEDDLRADQALREVGQMDRDQKSQVQAIRVAEWASQTIDYLMEIRAKGLKKNGLDPAHYRPDGCPVAELMDAVGFRKPDWPAVRTAIDGRKDFVLGYSPASKGYFAGMDGDQSDRLVAQKKIVTGVLTGSNRTLTALDNAGQIEAVRQRLALVDVDRAAVAKLIEGIALFDGPVLEQIGRALLERPKEAQ